jgi:hypothetical protein
MRSIVRQKSSLSVIGVLISTLCVTHGRCEDFPREGLRLWLAADEGLQVSDGKVSSWNDLSGNGFVASVPESYQGPEIAADGTAVRFSEGRLLRIQGAILPADTRQMTVAAVAQADSTSGVSILANRASSVPLVQLDVDESGMARFIVRDERSRTVRSLVPAELGERAVFLGVLKATSENRYTARVQFDARRGPAASSELARPLVGEVTWLGGLRLANRLYPFDGTVSELLVYDRALSQTESEQLVEYLYAKHDIQPSPPPGPDSFDVLDPAHQHAAVSNELTADVCVVGAGSGGAGAAVAAARRGASVVLVERQAMLGGTGTNALVSGWEPGPGCSVAEEIFHRMREIPGATGVGTWHANVSSFPMGQWYVTEGVPYSATLKRAGVPRDKMCDVPYLPDAFDHVVRDMLAETGNVTLLDSTTFFRAEPNAARTRVDAVLVEDEQGTVTRIRSKVFIDCTGCVYLCRAVGCQTLLGEDPRDRFEEPSAPAEAALMLNAISRCYMVRPSENPRQEPAPGPYAGTFRKCAHVTGWKDGVRVINPLPTLPGRALIDLGYDECLRRSEKITRAHWHWLQQQPEFEGYELDRIAPMLGIRESYRVVTKYVLREADLAAGLPGQTHVDVIAVADHPCDIHGAGGHLTPVATAYGIPYRCLIPQGTLRNLLVACRGSGFSKIAASSCRLQRTIIQLGHAAGAAAAMAVRDDCPVDAIDVAALVRELDARSRYPER